MSDGDFAFRRIFLPRVDGFRHRFIEFKQAVLDREHGQNSGEAFGAACEHVRGVCSPVIVSLVENFALVLDQDSVSAVSFRIVGSLDKQVFLNLGGVLS
jgi:hypothetical protein